MSLNYFERSGEKITCGVTCLLCGKEETITVYEGDKNDDDINAYVCEQCLSEDGFTPRKFNELVVSLYGRALNEVDLKYHWEELTRRNLEMGGAYINAYDYIDEMNLNDQKTRGI